MSENLREIERSCGSCTLCCKLMRIHELEKPPNKWCTHCKIGKGCQIYDTKPDSCNKFACLWLFGIGEEDMRPDKIRGFAWQREDEAFQVHVDPGYPDAYKEGKLGAIVKALVKTGSPVFVVAGDRRAVFNVDITKLGPEINTPEEMRAAILGASSKDTS